MRPGLRRTGSDAPNQAATRDSRLRDITSAVESFTYELAVAVAGDEPAFDATVSRELAQRLRAALRPPLHSPERMRPDFGSFAEVRIEGELLDSTRPVRVDVEFEDQSVRELTGGRLIPVPPRRVHLTLRVDLDPCVIRDCAVSLREHTG